MATIPKRAIDVAQTVSGNSPQTVRLPEAASQTFKKGALVALNASGYLAECGADPTAVCGVAAEDGHNGSAAGDYNLKLWVANDDTIFLANLGGSSVTALTDVARPMGVVAASSLWHVDKTDLTNTVVKVIGLDTRDTVGDTNGRVLFQFLGKVRQLASTS